MVLHLLSTMFFDYPVMSHYFSQESGIVHDKYFESAILKIINQNESERIVRHREARNQMITETFKRGNWDLLILPQNIISVHSVQAPQA